MYNEFIMHLQCFLCSKWNKYVLDTFTVFFNCVMRLQCAWQNTLSVCLDIHALAMRSTQLITTAVRMQCARTRTHLTHTHTHTFVLTHAHAHFVLNRGARAPGIASRHGLPTCRAQRMSPGACVNGSRKGVHAARRRWPRTSGQDKAARTQK